MTRQRKRLVTCLALLATSYVAATNLLQENSISPWGSSSLPAQQLANQKGPDRLLREFTLSPKAEQGRLLEKNVVHRYGISLKAGQFLSAIVEQDGVDLSVYLGSPRGKLFVIDSPTGDKGREEVFLLAESSGMYWMDLQSKGSGSYRVRVLSIRVASVEDKKNFQAEKFFYDALEIKKTKPDLAIHGFLKAEELWRESGYRKRQADAFVRVREVNLTKQPPNWKEALKFSRLALECYRAEKDRQGESRMLNSVGVAQKTLGEIDLAEKSYREALRLAKEGKFHEEQADVLLNLGIMHREQRDLWAALEFAEGSLAQWRKTDRRDKEVEALNYLSLIYSDLGKPQQAMSYLKQAEDLLKYINDLSLRGQTLTRLSGLYEKSGYSGLALVYAQRALGYRKKAGSSRGVAVTLTSIGAILEAKGDLSQARRYQEEALGIFRQIQDIPGEATALINIGYLLIADNPSAAIERLEQGLLLARQHSLKELEFVALYGLARAERARGNPIAAIHRAKASLEVADTLDDWLSEDAPKTASEAARQGCHKLLIDLLIKSPAIYTSQADLAEAFEASDRRRQRTLRNAQPSRVKKGLLRRSDQNLVEELEDLNREIYRIEGERLRENARIDDELDILVEKRRTLETQMLQKQTSESTDLSASLVSLSQTQQMLDADTILLQYELGRSRSFLWRITSNSAEVYELPPRLEIEESARRFQGWLSESWAEKSRKKAEVEGQRLSRMLLAPVAGKLQARRIVIVPDGALHYVSFAALPDPSKVKSVWSNPWPVPLIARHVISIVPSVSFVKAVRSEVSRRKRPERTLAVFADPQFVDKQVRQLKYSKVEAERILALVPRERRFEAQGSRATRTLFVSGFLRGYRLIHLATHAWNHPEHPELATILLSQKDEKGQHIDGNLRRQEIEALQIPADLVVLSGCETALGNEVEGEGLLGLSQGFFSAGAARVMASLWKVSDRSTADFMEQFYKAHLLADGQPPSEALRAAQLWMAQETGWGSPYYWAGFQIQGEWQ